ncbi:MAG: endo-beta-N-acetylglucosaminidase, partial [Paramuribaculum sp.]|nr:endo-beta-N-acetylglucosaminidase [Paramuribaculum sp.]
GSWYNMSQQDIVPTYRWLVTKKGDMKVASSDLDVRFSHEDAYMAGSSLKISGATTAGADVVLYRTALQVTEGNPMVTLAVKGAQGETNLSVIIKKQGSSEWIEVPFGALAGKTWEEKTLAIAGLAKGDVIENIGLRVNSANEGFKTYVGKLRISDDRNVTHAAIREGSLIAEVRQEYTTQLSLRLGWQPNYDGYDTSINDFGMVFNDEINVDHFEIFYKEGQDGAIKEVGRTAQWATFIGNLPCAQNTDAYIGVRSVSVDLKHNSPIEWVRVPHSEGNLPELTEEDPYGVSNQTSIGNGTAENCLTHIWVEKVTTEGATQNLNYQVTSNPCVMEDNQYYFAQDHKLVLTQGDKVKLTYKGNDSGTSESLKYDFVNAYIDYDGNFSFLDADETLGKFGNLNAGTTEIVNPGLTIEFTVPEDAHIGSSRLRIVGSDAWTPHPGATGGTVKGYSIDFPVEIVGTNPDRGPAETYKDRRDEGEPDQPENADGNIFNSIESIDAATDNATVTVVDGVAYFTNTEKAWFYDATGRFVKYVDGAESVNVSDLNGVYVVKLLNKQVIRSAKVVVK